MMTKHFRWPFLALLAAFFFATNVAEVSYFGVSSKWSSRDGYLFSGGTQLWALAFAGTVIGFYFLLMYAESGNLAQPLPGVFRRFVAFWIDFALAMIAVGPILGIVPMLVEWKRTGIFRWSFERTSYAPGDALLVTAALMVGCAALVLYYALPLVYSKPSPGTCITGYQVVAEEGPNLTLRTALLRTLLGFVAVCGAYVAPFVARDRENGKFWLDKVFGTRALRLS